MSRPAFHEPDIALPLSTARHLFNLARPGNPLDKAMLEWVRHAIEEGKARIGGNPSDGSGIEISLAKPILPEDVPY